MSNLFVHLSNIELETVEFTMGTLMDAVMSQGMIRSREKGLQVIHEMPAYMKNMCIFDSVASDRTFSMSPALPLIIRALYNKK